MKRILRYFLVSVLLVSTCGLADAQSVKTHKVKKDETIYGIARANGITEAELRKANPGMEKPGYVLKKGEKILIPIPAQTEGVNAAAKTAKADDDVRQRTIRMGVMLPLHDINGDGRRMVEYYRGLLMACDTLKQEGISVDVYAWNTPDDSDIAKTLAKPEAAACDVIFGPLYSKQMEQLSAFCEENDIMLVIPFSINAPQLATNSHIFQVYQAPAGLNESTSRRMVEWFKDANVVIVDCEDPNSSKGGFTSALRKQLEDRGQRYNLTSLKAVNTLFASSFSTQRQNVVVLNSARTSDLEVAFVKLKDLVASNPSLQVAVFGYHEWTELADRYRSNFHRFNMYIPAPYCQDQTLTAYRRLAHKYRSNFKQDMSSFTPKLALTGFDHGVFFLRGLHKYGATFNGAAGSFGYQPVQTPLKFVRVGDGGWQNRAFMFVHYKQDGQIETLNY